MFRRKMWSVLLVVLFVAVCSASGWAQAYKVSFTGPIFDLVQNGVKLCAQVCPAVAGVPVRFHGITPWGVEFDAGPVYTNELGKASALKIVPQGVYAVQVTAGDVQNPITAGSFRFPLRTDLAAVTVLACYAPPFEAFSSFAEYLPCPNRCSTFGGLVILQIPNCQFSVQILYIDPKGVIVTAKSIMLAGPAGPNAIELKGLCMFQACGNPPVPAHYDIVLVGNPNPMASITITDFAFNVLYTTGLQPAQKVNYGLVL